MTSVGMAREKLAKLQNSMHNLYYKSAHRTPVGIYESAHRTPVVAGSGSGSADQ